MDGYRRAVRSARKRPSSDHAVRKLQSQPRTNSLALSLLANKHEAHSKSVSGLDGVQPDKKINRTAKQAWAPSPKNSLSSRSFYSPDHSHPLLPPLQRPEASTKAVKTSKSKDESASLATASNLTLRSASPRSSGAFGRVS